MHSVKISAVKIWRFRASVRYFVRPSKGLKSHSDELGLETPAGNQLSWVLLYIYSNREVSIFSPYSINNKYIQWHFCRTSLITSLALSSICQVLCPFLETSQMCLQVESPLLLHVTRCLAQVSHVRFFVLCIHIWAGNSWVSALITNNLHKKWQHLAYLISSSVRVCSVNRKASLWDN